MSTTFDLLVIGAGSGGIATANRAASYGQRVGVIEISDLGGTCVNRGCVPKKVMWYAAKIAQAHQYSPDYGFINTDQIQHQWGPLIANRDAYIARIHQSYQRSFDQNKITLIQGQARFIDSKTVAVNKQVYQAQHIVIASGGQPIVPQIPGAEHGQTSDDFFTWQTAPQSVAIVGAGYIAVELAGMLNALGIETHLIIRQQTPIRKFDHTIAEKLTEHMHHAGIKIHTQVAPKSLAKQKNGLLRLQLASEQYLDVEKVIWAIGRKPNIDDLQLEKAQITCTPLGYIQVDDWQNTSTPFIYALGDVTGKVELTPVAVAAGRTLAERLFNKKENAKIDYDDVPSVIFSHPPIGTIGLTQAQAEQVYGRDAVNIYQTEFTAMYSAVTRYREKTLMKLICRKTDEKIVGLHLIGESADEILQGFAVAISMGATKADLDRCIAIHPTSAEELVTLTTANKIG